MEEEYAFDCPSCGNVIGRGEDCTPCKTVEKCEECGEALAINDDCENCVDARTPERYRIPDVEDFDTFEEWLSESVSRTERYERYKNYKVN